MWIDFKPIYNTLETQTAFVRELRPQNTPDLGSLQQPPDLPAEPSSLHLGWAC